MKNKKIITIAILILILIILIAVGNLVKDEKKDDSNFNILTSFYPIYVMTTNITDGANNVEVSNMADHLNGCIHDYTLNTSDLRKFENADVFIQNGKELESFTEKIIELYPDVRIIETSKNISKLIQDEEEVNPHIWLSINNYIEQINSITEGLSELNPENRDIYINNSLKYKNRLNELKSEYSSIENVSGKKAICLNEALVYLLNELEIDVESIETDHEQASLSAQNIKDIIEKMKKENIKAIFIDKSDNRKTAETLSAETGAKIYVLDSGMNDDYIKIMKENLEVLKNVEF